MCFHCSRWHGIVSPLKRWGLPIPYSGPFDSEQACLAYLANTRGRSSATLGFVGHISRGSETPPDGSSRSS